MRKQSSRSMRAEAWFMVKINIWVDGHCTEMMPMGLVAVNVLAVEVRVGDVGRQRRSGQSRHDGSLLATLERKLGSLIAWRDGKLFGRVRWSKTVGLAKEKKRNLSELGSRMRQVARNNKQSPLAVLSSFFSCPFHSDRLKLRGTSRRLQTSVALISSPGAKGSSLRAAPNGQTRVDGSRLAGWQVDGASWGRTCHHHTCLPPIALRPPVPEISGLTLSRGCSRSGGQENPTGSSRSW